MDEGEGELMVGCPSRSGWLQNLLVWSQRRYSTDEWLTDDVWSHIHTSHPHLHHQDTPSPPNDHFQMNPTGFSPPVIHSLSLLQRVTSSSPGLNAPAPTYLTDHSKCPGFHTSSLWVHPAFSPPHGCNKSFTLFSASSGVSLVVCLSSAGARARTLLMGTQGTWGCKCKL